jgi:hypothetical protein
MLRGMRRTDSVERIIDYLLFSTRPRKPYFIVNSAYGDCGHCHRTARAAQYCLKRVEQGRLGLYNIYRIRTRPRISGRSRDNAPDSQ